MHARQLLQSALFVLILILPTSFASAAQSSGVDVRIWTVDSNGNAVYDVCYTLVEYSNLGCDENRDGNVLFQDVAPGRYYVEPQTQDGGFYYAEPFTILIDELHTDHVVEAFPFRGSDSPTGSSTTPESVDVHLLMRDPETGESLTDVCFELVGHSNIGCDENADGHVTFADIPVGDYTIRQTTTPPGYPTMDDYEVTITGGPETYNGPTVILLSQSEQQAPAHHSNISIVYYRESDGMRVNNEHNCAQIFPVHGDATLIGCDENVMDGQIDFMHVELGPDNQGFSLDINLACPYGIAHGYGVSPGSGFERDDFGESTFSMYIRVSTEVRDDCG